MNAKPVLKVGLIKSVENHPNADKLYVLRLFDGKNERTIVAGLKNHYRPEELENKKIVFVANMRHTKIRGIESQGMILAGDDGKTVAILTIEKAEPGTYVVKGDENSFVSFEELEALQMKIENGQVFLGNEVMKAENDETVKVDKAMEKGIVR